MTRANVGTVAAHSSSTPLLRLGLKPSSREFYDSSKLACLVVGGTISSRSR